MTTTASSLITWFLTTQGKEAVRKAKILKNTSFMKKRMSQTPWNANSRQTNFQPRPKNESHSDHGRRKNDTQKLAPYPLTFQFSKQTEKTLKPTNADAENLAMITIVKPTNRKYKQNLPTRRGQCKSLLSQNADKRTRRKHRDLHYHRLPDHRREEPIHTGDKIPVTDEITEVDAPPPAITACRKLSAQTPMPTAPIGCSTGHSARTRSRPHGHTDETVGRHNRDGERRGNARQ